MTAAKLPPVGVVVTCYNCAPYAGEAIASVARQTVRNLEVIVVDDASTDGTAEAIREALARLDDPRFRFIPLETNVGQAGAARRGFGELRTPFVCFLDGDDVWYETFVERHLAVHMNTDFPVGFTYCDSHFINGDSELLTGTAWWFERPGDDPPDRAINPATVPAIDPVQGVATYTAGRTLTLHAQWSPAWSCNSMASLMFRRDLVELVFPETDQQMRLYLDYYLATFGILLAGCIAIHEPLYAYRMHGKNSHSKGSVVGGTFETSHNDWGTISNGILRLIHSEMLARRDRICAAIGAEHFNLSFDKFSACLSEKERELPKRQARLNRQPGTNGGMLVRLGALFGNAR